MKIAYADGVAVSSASVISFPVIGRPRAKGRPRATVRLNAVRAAYARGGLPAVLDVLPKALTLYTPPETAEAEESFRGNARVYAPAEPLTGPLILDIVCVFRVPKSGHVQVGDPYEPAPDTDNLSKLIKDALNGLFWVDDKQVVDERTRKVYGVRDETRVTITRFTKGGLLL